MISLEHCCTSGHASLSSTLVIQICYVRVLCMFHVSADDENDMSLDLNFDSGGHVPYYTALIPPGLLQEPCRHSCFARDNLECDNYMCGHVMFDVES